MNPRHRIESPVSPKVQATVLFLSLCLAHPAESIITPAPPAALNSNATLPPTGHDYAPDVVTDGKGTWIAVWESQDTLQLSIGTDYDILFARSTDDGVTWTDPVPLNSNAHTDSGLDRNANISTDGSGVWLVVWESSNSLGGTIGTDYDILSSCSTNNGMTWTDPAPLNANADSDSGSDLNPHLATDGAGVWVAVWESTDPLGGTIGTDRDILFARSTDEGATWTDPVPLASNAYTDSGVDINPKVAGDGKGNWMGVWSTRYLYATGTAFRSDSDIRFTASADNGATWTDVALLNDRSAEVTWNANPHVSMDEAGLWVAVWESGSTLGGIIGTDADIMIVRSMDLGSSWTDPAPLNNNAAVDSGGDWFCQVSPDGFGNWLAVWNSTDTLNGSVGDDVDILFARSFDDCATWTIPAPVGSHALSDRIWEAFPKATTNREGAWIVVWEIGAISMTWDMFGVDKEIAFVRSLDHGATWSDLRPLNTNAESDIGSDLQPQVVTDGEGVWVCVWTSSDSLVGTIGIDDDILFARSLDNGATWTEAAPLNTNASTDSRSDRHPHAAADGKGNWVAVWEDSRILFARSSDHGATWTDPAPLDNFPHPNHLRDINPKVAADGQGNWIVVWESQNTLGDTIGSDSDILAVQSADDGRTWTDPFPLNNNAGSDTGRDWFPQVVFDGSGSWFCFWTSDDSLGDSIGNDNDILFAKSSDGLNWTDPRPMNNDASSDSAVDWRPQATTDRDGNWVIVWATTDYTWWFASYSKVSVASSSDNCDTWTSPVRFSGGGVSTTGLHLEPQVATDRAGNWIVVWTTNGSRPFTNQSGDTFNQFACSADNGATWGNPISLSTIPPSSVSVEYSPHLSTDGAGNWVAVWRSSDTLSGTIGGDWDILYTTFFLDPESPVRSFDVVKDGSVDSKDLLVWLSKVIKGEEERTLLFEFAQHWDSVVGSGEP